MRASTSARRPADDLELLSLVRLGLALLETIRDEHRHALVDEAGRRPERRELAPAATVQTRLLAQLALRRRQRLFSLVDEPCRELEQLATGRHAALAHEHDALLGVEGDDRDRVGRVGDLVAVLDERPRSGVPPRPSSHETFHVRALLTPEPGRLSGRRVLGRALGAPRRRDHQIDALVRERPLQQRLRPGSDAELGKRARAPPAWARGRAERPRRTGA